MDEKIIMVETTEEETKKKKWTDNSVVQTIIHPIKTFKKDPVKGTKVLAIVVMVVGGVAVVAYKIVTEDVSSDSEVVETVVDAMESSNPEDIVPDVETN